MHLRHLRLLPCMAILLACSCGPAYTDPYRSWRVTGGSKTNLHYSSLTEIDTTNVQQLQVAWTYHSGDADTATHSQIQCNPIVVDGILYATSPALKVVAVDAATGVEKWRFDPRDSIGNPRWHTSAVNINRGVTYWADEKNAADQRIIYTVGAYIFELQAQTGKLIKTFGDEGAVDLHKGLGRDVSDLYIAPTSPGMIYHDLYIVGGRVNEAAPAAPGHIRAFDVRTGKQAWIFHTIPEPGEPGYETWDDTTAYHFIGAANNWSGFSLDEERGILYAPTGSAAFDFYGGKRHGNGLYANCLLALDAATGKLRWHFQSVHHDVWDRDLPTPPALITVMHDGRKVDAVAQPSKTGFVFVLDRETGKPVFPIEEKPVPTETELAGERLSPTQPVPSKPAPFVRQSFTEADINPLLSDTSRARVAAELRGYRSGHLFNAPSKEGTVIFPGFDGGAEWGGPAFDPVSGLLIVNANEMPWVLTMVDAKPAATASETNLQAGQRLYAQHCMSCHGPERKGAGNYPSLLGVEQRINFDQFHALLSNGRRMMPAFKQLSKEEEGALGSFILNLRQQQNGAFKAPVKPLDTVNVLPYSFTGYNKWEKEGYPAVKPPWGTLNAIYLNTGELAWRIPFGEFAALKAKGVPATGTENYGGPAVTAGGLIFIAATRDGKFRAIHSKTGKVLFETDLPFPGYATPAVYEVNGKEFVVVACGGGKLKTASGDAYVAFSLK